MNDVVLKFELFPSLETQTIQTLPAVRMLRVGFQGDKLFVWAQVRNTGDTQAHHMLVVPTGVGMVPSNSTYIGTAETDEGLVFHVFETFPDAPQ